MIQEVYAFEMLLIMGLLATLAGRRELSRARSAAAGFLAGCLVAHRPTDLLFLPFFSLLLRREPHADGRPTSAGKVDFHVALAAFVAAYLPYAHTWWHLRNRFSMNYFDYPKDFETFVSIVTGRSYAGHVFALPALEALAELKRLLAVFASELGGCALALAAVGLVWGSRKRRPELATIVGVALVNAVFCANHHAVETNTMALPGLAMVCWLVAFGVEGTVAAAGKAGRSWQCVAAVLLALAPWSWLPGGWKRCDRSSFEEVSRYLADLDALLPRGARLITTTDVDTFPMLYARFALGRRTDLEWTTLERWDEAVEKSIGPAVAAGRPVYSSLFLGDAELARARAAFGLCPEGFVYRLLPREKSVSESGPARLDLADATLQAWPGICAIRATGPPGRAARPGVLVGFGSGLVATSGALVPLAAAGRACGRIAFRSPMGLQAGRHELFVAGVDMALVESELVAGRLGSSVVSIAPASADGAAHFKERDLRYVFALRSCVPFGEPYYEVADVRALARMLAAELAPQGSVQVIPARPAP
ncbi:MAG: hypothetical protein HY775_13415 [Acidobacteria bacterium]|nr:hypothetical protein [Acidobacteriota bacterium]